MSLSARHIQNFSSASRLEPHWGYAARVLPCTNDAGTCAYLDLVYGGHDRGMVYAGIFWLTVVAVVAPWSAWRTYQWLQAAETTKTTRTTKTWTAAGGALVRRYLLPEASSRVMRTVFGRTTRLQIGVLAVLVAYLSVWTFAGLTYQTWRTPVKGMEGVYNRRSTLGPWADRLGILAFALTPLSVLLGARESLLSLLTGVPYQSFLFLHRWVGYVVVVQSLLHTFGWVLIEAHYYQPQPTVWRGFVGDTYVVWGFVALGLLVLLLAMTMPCVYGRVGGYETFRKAHYILAALYVGALIGHWRQLACFLVPSLGLWGIDRALRLARVFLLHSSGVAPGRTGALFAPADARVTLLPDTVDGDVVRLDFLQPEPEPAPWQIGMHYYLCFTEGSIWQSHPLTPLNDPTDGLDTVLRDAHTPRETHTLLVPHAYVFRARGGETKRIAKLVADKLAASAASDKPASEGVSTPVILTGPYGQGYMADVADDANVLCIAGGTGITFVLPALLRLARHPRLGQRQLRLVWSVRRAHDVDWIAPELQRLRACSSMQIDIFVTGGPTEESDSAFHAGRPDLPAVVAAFVAATTTGPTAVIASGPAAMVTTLRSAVAAANEPASVWAGDLRHSVRLIVDDRIE